MSARFSFGSFLPAIVVSAAVAAAHAAERSTSSLDALAVEDDLQPTLSTIDVSPITLITDEEDVFASWHTLAEGYRLLLLPKVMKVARHAE